MLNNMYPTVYNNSEKRGNLWTEGYVLFARLKNHMIVFTKAKKARMDMQNNVRFVDLKKVVNITKTIQESALKSMKDGLKEIQKRYSKIKELIITEIRKRFWRKRENHAKKMDIETQKLIEKEIDIKLIVTTLWLWLLNLVISKNPISAKNVKTIVAHMHIIMIIQSLWILFGFVENVMEKNIGYFYQRERLNLWTPKGDVIVQTTEETCRGEFEAVPSPSNWSVGKLLPKVIAWLRHTAGCSFYQGQCITNDLWVQNLRSSGI